MDDFTSEELEQLFAVFRDQSLRILEEMGQDMLLLEARGADDEAMIRLRRAAHTIKGDSACVGLEGVTELAHRIEDILDNVLSSGAIFDKHIVDLVLEALDAIHSSIGADDMQDIPSDVLEDLVSRIAVDVGEQAERSDSNAPLQPAIAVEAPEQPITESRDLAKKASREYVRVEAERIDALLNLAGEMVIARSVLNELGPHFEQAMPKNDLVPRFGGVNLQMGKLIAELQKSVLKMRMVTIDNVFRRFARPMRELAVERGKTVELEFRGGETELDRTLVDLLYEPLLHLLRNAVDHGIETTEDRERAGKPLTGRIKLQAYHEGNQVVVEVGDDGRGIDIESLKRKAIEAGSISPAEAERISDEEAQELIFVSGLSTAPEITLVSGRGIGAATVKSAIEQLRGTISVKSELGAGTTFILRMPLTLAIIKALLFTAGGQLFALPLLAVSEIARGTPEDIVYLDGLESLRLRNRFISMVRPGIVLGFDRRKGGLGAGMRRDAGHFFVIVLTAGSKKYGVVADSLLGEQELLIKPLDSKWVQNEALAGASVLGDGRVVLIMDAGMIFRKASGTNVTREMRKVPMQSEKRKIRVLVVDDSAVMRKLIPGLLEKDSELEVVATAIDGDFALNKVDQLKPDVVTLDVDMPRMDGLTALSHIVSKHAIPVIMLSSLTTRGAALTMKALEMGAVDFICKPKAATQIGDMAGELISKIKAAARSKVVPSNAGPVFKRTTKKKAIPLPTAPTGKIVAIGASSGGPHALRYLLPRIPSDFGAAIVIVQHMPESFTAMFAQWLDEICEIEVREARDGDLATPGLALIAPGNAHLRVRKRTLGAEVSLEKGKLVNGHMPSVDVTFESVASQYGADALALLMTGMGSDGSEGMGLIGRAGGHTVAQDKDSCAIFGMPRVAIEKGYAEKVVSLADMADYLISAVGKSHCLEVTGYGQRR